MIHIHSLSKYFGDQKVLSSVQLDANRGEVIGIVGENGAGKTTLFKCMAGLYDYEGEIRCDVSPMKDILGLLVSEQTFIDKITAREYLHLMLLARKQGIDSIDSRNIFDLPLDAYISTFSTGMKKKLALLGVLLQNNEIFILDEPYNGVDIQSNLIISEIILELKRKNKLVIISSHIFSTLRDTCDRIYVLQNGSFTQCVERSDFDRLEDEMKQISIGNRLERLKIT